MKSKTANSSANPAAGAVLMVLAVLSFVMLDSTAKYLAEELPMPQLLWGRYLFSLVFLLSVAPFIGWRGLLITHRLFAQTLRGLLLVGATASVFAGVRYLPIAEFYSISFVSPAIVAVIAALALGEHVGMGRWAAILLGFAGVLVVIRPGAGAVSFAAAFPLAMATFYALFQIVTRILGAGESPLTTVFYTMLVGSLATTAIVPFFWTTPDLKSCLALAWMGAIGLTGQLLLVKAFQYAQASLLSPLSYTQIVWATLIGYVVFGDIPDFATVTGSCIVIASGLLLAHPRLAADHRPLPNVAAPDQNRESQ